MWYIIDVYSPYDKNEDVKYIFEYNNKLWCVREVHKFEWGRPQFDEESLDDDFLSFYIYDNLDDAITYCRSLKGII